MAIQLLRGQDAVYDFLCKDFVASANPRWWGARRCGMTTSAASIIRECCSRPACAPDDNAGRRQIAITASDGAWKLYTALLSADAERVTRTRLYMRGNCVVVRHGPDRPAQGPFDWWILDNSEVSPEFLANTVAMKRHVILTGFKRPNDCTAYIVMAPLAGEYFGVCG